jgi:hypothetical protein
LCEVGGLLQDCEGRVDEFILMGVLVN